MNTKPYISIFYVKKVDHNYWSKSADYINKQSNTLLRSIGVIYKIARLVIFFFSIFLRHDIQAQNERYLLTLYREPISLPIDNDEREQEENKVKIYSLKANIYIVKKSYPNLIPLNSYYNYIQNRVILFPMLENVTAGEINFFYEMISWYSFYPYINGKRIEISIDELYDQRNNYKTVIAKNLLLRAKSFPIQTLSWSCGLNSSARVFIMILGCFPFNYDQWVENAPQYLSKNATISNGGKLTSSSIILTSTFMGISPFLAGGPILIYAFGLPLVTIGTTTSIVGSQWLVDTGPSPENLAGYFNQAFERIDLSYEASFKMNNKFDDCLKDLEECVLNNKPVILLLLPSIDRMHYVNLIGIKYNEEQEITHLVTLDTNSKIFEYRIKYIKNLLKNPFYTSSKIFSLFKKGKVGYFNHIEISPKEGLFTVIH